MGFNSFSIDDNSEGKPFLYPESPDQNLQFKELFLYHNTHAQLYIIDPRQWGKLDSTFFLLSSHFVILGYPD